VREEVAVALTLSINGEFHIHHHHHHNSPQPGAADIINLIQDFRKEVMTQLDTSTAKESGDLQTLITATEALETAFANLQSQNNSALQAALDAANLDSATQAKILDANDSAIQDEITKVNTLLNPPQNTVSGGNGDDSVGGGTGGTGTLSGGQGTDTVTGTTTLSVTSSSTNLPDAVTGQGYTGHIDISGGQAPYSVQVDTASVNGLTMDDSGVVTGTSTADGTVNFAGTVADSSTPNQHAPFSVSFNSAAAIQSV
jgi:hypothetical protein